MAQVLAVPRSDDPDGPPLGRRRRLQSIFSRRSDRSHRVLRHGIRCFLLALKLVSIGVPRTGDPPDGAIGYQQPPFGSPTSSSQLLTFRNSKASDPPVAMGCTSGLFCGICLCTFAISSLIVGADFGVRKSERMQAEKGAQSAQLHDPEHDHAGTSVARQQGVLDPVEKAECERFGNGLSPNMPNRQYCK
ncbi:hypothetical protein L804_02869 [Cryptococcus deuterogattii 2001/935-1]|nr:hypothetical protein L804_02869 [Cryptococcus deuterogattii 2001/935-1]